MKTEIDLDKLEQVALAATPGPYQIVVDKFDTHHEGYQHTQRRIFTQWDHPQLKGPIGVVNTSYGIGEKEGDPLRHMVSIDEGDAEFFAAASPDVVLELVRRLRAAEADVKRLDFMVSDKCMMDSTLADSSGMRYWLSWPYSYTEQGTTFRSTREAIDAAIAAQGASHD